MSNRPADPGPDDGLRFGTPSGRWVIATTVAGSGIASLDATVVSIALPVIGRDFHAGVAALQWVVSGYLLALSGLLLLGGALGDRYGRRRVYLIGVVWFAGASLLCGIAPNPIVLDIARVLQGVGSALLTPGSLAILESSFVPKDRSRAIGAWSGLGGVSTAIGPFLGGYLISAFSWRWIFFINLPLSAAVVLFGVRHIPESRDPDAAGRIDVLGAAFATAGLFGVIYGLIEGPTAGWATSGIAIALGVLATIGFVVVELRTRHPLLPMTIFRTRQFSAANLVTFAVYGALGGTFFLLPVQLEQVLHYSPLAAGAAALPVTVLMLLLSARFGALSTRVGPRALMTVGPLVVALGLAWIADIGAGAGYLSDILPAVLVFGLGLSITVAPLTSTVLAAASVSHAGIASAVNNNVARAASLIAVAVLPAAAGISGSSYLHPSSFSSGYHSAILICSVTSAIGGALAWISIRNPPRLAPQAPPARSVLDDPLPPPKPA